MVRRIAKETLSALESPDGELSLSLVHDREIAEIQDISASKRYPKGTLIFSEDEQALGFFVLISGKVKVYKLSPEGKEQILHIISPGETFAEAALFAGSTYPAFAESLAETEALRSIELCQPLRFGRRFQFGTG